MNIATFKRFPTNTSLFEASTETMRRRGLTENFSTGCNNIHQQLSIRKTKELEVDHWKIRRPPVVVIIQGEDVGRMDSYKFLGLRSISVCASKSCRTIPSLSVIRSCEGKPYHLLMFFCCCCCCCFFGIACIGGVTRRASVLKCKQG